MSLPTFPGSNPEDNFGAQPAPAPRGRKTAIVIGASVLSLAVLAGGGFAAASVLNKATDHDISIALPQSTSAFVQADLDPSPGQKINLASVAGKIKDIVNAKDYDANKDPKEMFTDPFFSDLDYKTDVQPWIGDKVAFGAWGDFGKAANDATTGEYSPNQASTDVNAVVVYEIKDKDKAEEAAKKMDDKTFVYEVNKDYLIIAPSQSALDSYNAEIAKGTLDQNKTFTDDRNLLNGQDDVAMSWVNAGDLHADEVLNGYLSNTIGATTGIPDNLNGRVVTGVSLSNNSLKVSSKLVGFDTTGYSTEKGLNDIGNLPDNSNVVLGLKDGKTAATKAWNTYQSVEGLSPANSMKEELQQIGVALPDDFGAILGSETSIGATIAASSDSSGFTYRAKDGDVTKIGGIVKSIGAEGTVTTTDENGTAVVKYGSASSNGKLGDSPKFKSVTGDLNNAQSVLFVDINKFMHERGNAAGEDSRPDVNYGVAGMTSSLDASSKIVSIDINWAF